MDPESRFRGQRFGFTCRAGWRAHGCVTSLRWLTEGARMIDLDTDIKTAIKCKNGELVITRTQDTTPYIEQNVKEFNEAPTWRPYAGKRKLRKVAEIPNIVVEQWLKEGINIFSPDPAQQRAFRAKLDDYTNQKLRTYPGRLGMRRQWV